MRRMPAATALSLKILNRPTSPVARVWVPPHKLHGIAVQTAALAADLHDANHVAIFFAEELHDVFASLDFRVGHFGPGHAGVLQNPLVDQPFDVGHLGGVKRGAAEIESQFIRPDVGTFLRGIGADDFVQSPMEQMGDGMMPLDGVAAGTCQR